MSLILHQGKFVKGTYRMAECIAKMVQVDTERFLKKPFFGWSPLSPWEVLLGHPTVLPMPRTRHGMGGHTSAWEPLALTRRCLAVRDTCVAS
jgi:hypothetical protein